VDKNKLSHVKLDPLSIEKSHSSQKSPPRPVQNFKKSIEIPPKIGGPTHPVALLSGRPTSEEQAKIILANKLHSKQVFKPNLKPLGERQRSRFVQTLQPTRSEQLEDLKSPNKESKLKMKFKTAKLTEQDISKQIKEIPSKFAPNKEGPSDTDQKVKPRKKNRTALLLYGELALAKKFESPALYEQKMRSLNKDADFESEKNEADETIKEMIENSFNNLGSSRVTKKTHSHSTHLSWSTSDSKDSDLLGSKSYSVEGHLAKSSDEKTLNKMNWQSTLNEIREKENHEEKEAIENENKVEEEPRKPPMLFGRKSAGPTGKRPVFFTKLMNKDQGVIIPVRPEDYEKEKNHNQENNINQNNHLNGHLEEKKDNTSSVQNDECANNITKDTPLNSEIKEPRKSDSREGRNSRGSNPGSRNSQTRKESFNTSVSDFSIVVMCLGN